MGTEHGGSPDGHSKVSSPSAPAPGRSPWTTRLLQGWSRPPGRRPVVSSSVVVLVFSAAGMLFATSAETARGTQLRADRTDLAALIRSENAKHDAKARQLAALGSEIDQRTAAEAAVNGEVAALRARSALLSPIAGLSAVTGPGLVVRLDDAPSSGTRPADALPDDLVVHQQDVQAVVNALWAGGAEAMMLMDQRVIATSAVRCVGNTLILQGRVYSPPFTVAAVGDPGRLQAGMDASPTIPIYLQYVQRYGLGWRVEQHDALSMPAYSGTMTLRFATVSPSPGEAVPPSSPSPASSTGA
ncbi:MAG TPA: DUF881 domain-containing protein [Kineosporiaceae bacterium]|nr:DUF881 domain-containing protein [Kineosporiaceae bacterium]